MTAGVERPYLRVANVFDGYIDTSDINTMFFTDTEYELFKVLPGDILLNEGQSLELVGRAAMYRGEPGKYCYQNTLVRFRPNGRLCGHFAVQLFRFFQRTGKFAAIASKTTSIAHLGGDRFARLKIPVPPLGEQRRIAEILEAWDEAIEKVQALIQAKQKLKRGLMQQLLSPTRRFPQFNGKVKSRAMAEFFKHFKEANGSEDRMPLSCSKIHGIIPQSEKFAKRVASADLRRYQVVRFGNLVFDPMLLWDASISFVEKVDEGVISPAYSTFHFNEASGDRTYFCELIKSHRMRHWYKVISRGTNQRRRKAMPEDFLQIPMPVPTRDEQTRIGQVFNTINNEVAALQGLARNLTTQKRGLMQKLLTGQVRVTE